MRKRYAIGRPAPYVVAFFLMNSTALSTFAQAQSGGNKWNAFVTVRHTEELDRVRNDEPVPDLISNGADAGLSFATRTERSNVAFFGRAGANIYDDESFENQATYGAGFAWNYRTSSRSTMSLTQVVNKNLRLDTLSNLGVVANDFSTLSASTSWSFQKQSGPRTSWNAGLSYQFAEMTNSTPIPGSQIVLNEQPFGDEISIPLIDTTAPAEAVLPDGEQEILRALATEGLADPSVSWHNASASFGLNHAVGQHTTMGFSVNGGYRTIDSSFGQDGTAGAAKLFIQRALGVSNSVNAGYTFQRSFVVDPNTTIQTLFGGWSYATEDSGITANLSGGASRYEAQGNPATTQPVANVYLGGNLTQSTTASISYRRQFSMPTGVGRSLLTNYAHATIAQSFGSRVNASATIGASYGADPLDDDSKFETRRAGGDLSVGIVAGLSLGGSYYYVENEQRSSGIGFEETLRNWSLYLSYSADF